MNEPLVAGIELGGTKCIALLARGTEILATARFPTGDDPAATLAALSGAIDGWRAEHGDPHALGIGSFGPVGLDPARADYGFITTTPKPGWRDTDVVGHFAKVFGLPTAFDTDVNGAALAEQRWGGAQGCHVAIYLTIGTGIGGGVAIDGRTVHGLVHPEIGHIRVRRAAGDGFAGACPYHGDCLEGLAAGPGLAARTGMPGEQLPADHPVWPLFTGELAELMALLMLTLSPERILIGGGVFQSRPELFAPVRQGTAERLGGYVAGVDADTLTAIIVPPGLGDRAGPLGAVALAYAALSGSDRA